MEDGVDTALIGFRRQGVGAEAIVADENAATFQKVADALPQTQVVKAPFRERMTSYPPIERQKTTSILATRKPKPIFSVRDWGHCFWFSLVSGMEKLLPSNTFTRRPHHS